ncbi:MAG: hypothetical protein ACI8S6_000192 [Myxococcota bacterium]|jgi:hypothetical protein
MRPLLVPILLSALIGCAGRHLRTGDYAAASQDWEGAYSAYEQAAFVRPGSAKAQLRLADARREVMARLDAQLSADLQARRFAQAGRSLEAAGRYDPPRAWMDAHVETTLVAIRADAATRSLPEAHALLSECAVYRPLSVLSADRDAAGAAWADDLRAQAGQAAGRGELGGALVLLSGARQLREVSGDADQHAVWWSALRGEEWGGMHLSVRGPQAHADAVSRALTGRWSASPWSEAPVVIRAPDQPHLSAELTITAAGCEEAQVGREVWEHRYTDGTFVANPRIEVLHQQIRENTRSLRAAEAALSQAQQRLAAAQRRKADAEAAVASATPWLVEARGAIQEREAEVAVLLASQRERNTARRELEQRSLPARQADLDRTRKARAVAEAAHAEAQASVDAAGAALADAELRIKAARAALDSARPIQEAAAEAQAALPGHRSALRAAAVARKEAREALQRTDEANEEASRRFRELREAGDATQADLDEARRQQVEAREARAAAREALDEARKEAERLQEGLVALEDAIQRGAELDLEQSEADLAAARRDRDAAASALPAAEARQASTRRSLADAEARYKVAEASVREVRSRLDELSRADDVQVRRLGQIEAEISALSPSLALLSARATTLSRAERDRQEATRRLREAEATMTPLLSERQAASRQASERQALQRKRDGDRTTIVQKRSVLEAHLATTPAEVELVKVHPYTVTRWQRTCTFTTSTRTAATTSDDTTWAGFDYGGLSAEPLQYAAEDAADLAASREAVVALVWSDLSGTLRTQGDDARRRAKDPADLEAATRAWMLADWLSPRHTDAALADSLRARYPVPQR